MHEARLILPTKGNEGESLNAVHETLRRKLAKTFGGYTALPIYGGWIDDAGALIEEPGIAYDVAMDISEANRAALNDIAGELAASANQSAIYVRHAFGEVEFIRSPVTVARAA